MENIIYVTDSYGVEHAIIEHSDGSSTSMTKAEYDRRQAEQSTSMVAGDE
jgi:hypothetical protein